MTLTSTETLTARQIMLVTTQVPVFQRLAAAVCTVAVHVLLQTFHRDTGAFVCKQNNNINRKRV